MSVVCRRRFGARGRGAGGRTTRGAVQQPAQERGFFAAITHAQRGKAFRCTEEAYPACVDSNTATQAAGSRIANLLSSPYPTAGQRPKSLQSYMFWQN